MAKGVEDTALYRYTAPGGAQRGGLRPGPLGRLAGRGPRRATPPARERFPRGLLATQTHDTKRSGDVRARIGALSGIPGDWRERVLRWRDLNAPLRARRRAPTPARSTSSTRPSSAPGRSSASASQDYMVKAMREAKVNDRLGRSRRAPRAGGAALLRRALRVRASSSPTSRRFVAETRPARRGGGPRPDAPQAHRPRRPGHLPGRRAVVPVAGGPRQPPPGGLGPSPARSLDGLLAGGRADARDREAVPDPPRARRCAPGAPRRSRAPTARSSAGEARLRLRPRRRGDRGDAHPRRAATASASRVPEDLRGALARRPAATEVELGAEARLGDLAGALPGGPARARLEPQPRSAAVRVAGRRSAPDRPVSRRRIRALALRTPAWAMRWLILSWSVQRVTLPGSGGFGGAGWWWCWRAARRRGPWRGSGGGRRACPG